MEKNPNGTLSVIIPAYNEISVIGSFIGSLKRTLSGLSGEHEIIVVDDGSTDNTLKRANSFNVKTVCHEKRRGYGASLKSGIRQSGEEYVCIIDADNTYEPSDVLALFSEAGGYDMVVGDRGADPGRPKDHLFVKKAAEKVLFWFFGVQVKDINSGLRIMKRDIVMRYLDLLSNGFSFTSSITLIMLLKKHKIKYIPISYERRDRGSKIRRWDFVAAFLSSYVRIFWYYFSKKI
ncbi:MAG: glycosyltransferase family 2 protein [Candidatus Tantalella remota]|nr:glycosyltransferase family 2 protein [Candidatus Tantalella remota]